MQEKHLYSIAWTLQYSMGSLPSFLKKGALQPKDLWACTSWHVLLCCTPHNISHHYFWLDLCSLAEALKINEAFVLNHKAIYEYNFTYNKLYRLLFLSIIKGVRCLPRYDVY